MKNGQVVRDDEVDEEVDEEEYDAYEADAQDDAREDDSAEFSDDDVSHPLHEYAAHGHAYLAHHDDTDFDREEHRAFEPEDIHHTPWKLYAFLAIPFLEVLSPTVLSGENLDSMRALVVGTTTLTVLVFAFFDLVYQARQRASRHAASTRMLFQVNIWLGGLGILGLGLAAWWKNELYYVAADIYHWFIEFLLVSFLGVWACSGYSSMTISRAFTKTFLLLGLSGIGIVVMGVMGVPVGGGHAVDGFAMWRIELGRAFPLIPLIFVGAAFLAAPWHQRRLPWLAVLAVGALAICLIFTWKRTQWAMILSCYAALLGLMMPKRLISVAPLVFVLLGACLWAFHVCSPRTIPYLVDEVKEAVTYNENWTIDETLDIRQDQVEETFRVAAREPFGHGFGAEIQILTPNGKSVEKLHYVHSLYAYYALQFGAPGCLVALGVVAVLCLALYRAVGTNYEAQWMVMAGLVSWVALAGSGLMLVSIHTVFAGFVLAMSVVGLSRCLHPHPADGFAPPDDDGYDDRWHDDEPLPEEAAPQAGPDDFGRRDPVSPQPV